jgi:hypothetical protein
MTRISGQHRVSQVKRRRPDEQVLKRNLDTPALLLPVNSAGEERDPFRDRVDGDVGQQLTDERLAPAANFRRVCTVNAVRQFHQAHGRDGRLLIADRSHNALLELCHRFASALGRD